VEGAAAEEAFLGRPLPTVALRGDFRGDAVEGVVFCRLAAGAFLGEAGELLFREAGRLRVPEVTRLGPDAVDAARLAVEVVRFLGAALVAFFAVVVFLVTFLVAGFLVVFFVAAFLVVVFLAATGAFLVAALACLFRFFNSVRPASAIL